MEFNLTELVLALLQKYGIAGAALAVCYFYSRAIDTKLEKIINLNNKTFGVMLALVDKEKRAYIDPKGGSDD